MPNAYQLKFMDSSHTEIEFEAEDAFKALALAHDKATDRSAELWREGRKLCSIRRVQGEIWHVRPTHTDRLAR